MHALKGGGGSLAWIAPAGPTWAPRAPDAAVCLHIPAAESAGQEGGEVSQDQGCPGHGRQRGSLANLEPTCCPSPGLSGPGLQSQPLSEDQCQGWGTFQMSQSLPQLKDDETNSGWLFDLAAPGWQGAVLESRLPLNILFRLCSCKWHCKNGFYFKIRAVLWKEYCPAYTAPGMNQIWIFF